MGWTPTLIIAGAALVVAVVCGWRGARPPDLIRGPRLVPWRFLMLLGASAFALMLVHMATLLKGG
jgi:peptidoglycan/LPS O-acetylase OafA/YrhL